MIGLKEPGKCHIWRMASYWVNRDGMTIRRNRKHLRELPPNEEPNGDNDNANHSEHTEIENDNNDNPPVVQTRSGRISRPNPRYNDFVQY